METGTEAITLAYLILAHAHPGHLARMIDRLDHDSVEFFIHIDKRSDITPFTKLLGKNRKVHFIRERYKIFWRGYSQILATIALMKAALRCRARYYVLLSGMDYPLARTEEIIRFFQDKNTQYLHYFPLRDTEHFPNWLRKIQHYYFWDSVLTNPRQGIKSVRHRYKRFIQNKLLSRMRPRKYFDDLQPYGGSQWWMLTHDCVKYCLEFIARRADFSLFYRYTDAPDEMFFQTIVLNSPFKEDAIHFREYRDNYQALAENVLKRPLGSSRFNYRYINWYAPERGFPATLIDSDFDEMRGSKALFARKFDPLVSRSLLERIDTELLQISPPEYFNSGIARQPELLDAV